MKRKSKLKQILENYNISYDYGENNQTLYVKMCKVATPKHSYNDWVGNQNEDYGNWNQELLNKLQPFIKNSHLKFIDCENCCECGDW